MRIKDTHKQQAIFNAALKSIIENGFSGTSMSKIAKQAGVAPGTIYIYFENKEDLLSQLYLNAKTHLSHHLTQHQQYATQDYQAHYIELMNSFVDFMLHNQYEFLLIEQYQSSPLLIERIVKEGASLYQFLFDFFDQGRNAGVIKDADNQILVTMTFYTFMNYVKQFVVRHQQPDMEKLDEIIHMSWDAIAIS